MTTPQTRLTDELIASVIRSRSADPDGTILDDVMSAVAATPQERRWPRWLAPPPQLRLVLLAAALLAALAGAIAAGSWISRPDPAPVLNRNGEIVAVRDGSLVTIDPLTGVSQDMGLCSGECGLPSWSRDGSVLAFVRRNYVVVRDMEFGSESAVATCRSTCTAVSLSPNGTRVAYASLSEGWVSEVGDGSSPIAVPGTVEDLAWAPNSDELLLVGGGQISIWQPGDSQPIVILSADDLPAGDRPFYAAWSPDGEHIAYVADPRDNSLDIPYDYQLWVMDARGGNRHMIWDRPGCCIRAFGGPTWSPDGTRIATVASSPGPYTVWIVDVDGSHVRSFSSVFPERVAWRPAP
jgi:WD40 repeat protein